MTFTLCNPTVDTNFSIFYQTVATHCGNAHREVLAVGEIGISQNSFSEVYCPLFYRPIVVLVTLVAIDEYME